jgi:sporulation protein YlmC with PRC-barrel domain
MIDIEYELMDQGILDRDGDRCGRVDDVVVEEGFDRPPRVVALLSSGGAKSRRLGRLAHRLSRWLHRLAGMQPPIEPTCIPWEQVSRVDRDVLLNASADELGLNRLNEAVTRKWIRRLPGANS